MAAKVNELEEKKRQLLMRSEIYRCALEEDLRDIKIATAWVPKAVRTIRAVSPVLLLATPLLGYLFGKKRVRPLPAEDAPRRGWSRCRSFAAEASWRR